MSITTPYVHQKYLLKKQIFKLLGNNFRIYDESENLLFFCHQKAFRLKEDIRIYSDEAKTNEVLTIAARQIMDFSAAYDVKDSKTGEKIGALKRKGWSSMLRDSWIIMDANDVEIGKIVEDRMAFALIRRFIEFASLLVPQQFHVDVNGQMVMLLQQHFNPFAYKMTLDFSFDRGNVLDRRMGIALAVLLTAIEGRQR